jgi:hypothetical protein
MHFRSDAVSYQKGIGNARDFLTGIFPNPRDFILNE